MGRLSLWVLFGLTFLAVSLNDALVTADVGPTESECRPYIEKAINELKTIDADGTGSDEDGDDDSGGKENLANASSDDDDDNDDDDEVTDNTGEDDNEDSKEAKSEDQDSGEDDEKDSKENTAEVDDEADSGEKDDDVADAEDDEEKSTEKENDDDDDDKTDENATEEDDDDTTEKDSKEEATDSNENDDEIPESKATDDSSENGTAEKADDDNDDDDDTKETDSKEAEDDDDDNDDTKERASKEAEDDDDDTKDKASKEDDDDDDDDTKETTSKEAEDDDDDTKERTSKEAEDDDDDTKEKTSKEDDDDDDTKETASKEADDDDDDDTKEKSSTEADDDDDDNTEEKASKEADDDDDTQEAVSKEGDDDDDDDTGEKASTEADDDDDDTKETASKEADDDDDTKETASKEAEDDDDDTEEKASKEDDDDDDTKEKVSKEIDDDDDDDTKEKTSKEDDDDDDDTKEEADNTKEEDDGESSETATKSISDEVESEIIRKKRSVDAASKTVGKDDGDDDDDSKGDDQDDDDNDSKEKSTKEDDDDDKDSEEAKSSKEDDDDDDSEETQPEDDLLLEGEIPENLRDRKHISELLHLDDEYEERERAQERVAEIILRDIKRVYDLAIKPLETLYKYRDLSNRHFDEPEIFSKPLILFMGPWSGGKSSIINYLTDNEYQPESLRTGAEPSPAYFNILMWGNKTEVLDGTQLAADWTFSGLQKFGEGLEDRLRGLKMPSKLLEKVNIVEIPGILEVRKQVSRLFPFNDACQWFIDRADIIVLVYDPAKLDAGPETEAILDQLKGREYQTRILLNKADTVKPEELLRVQSALIWNISPLMSSAQPPVMYTTSLWSRPYDSNSPIRLLQAQERAFLRDLRTAVDKRIENRIASARRFAVRVRNHAKMVDCYLNTYYNHKTIFGNKKRISDEIIENPQNYHIYEGLSTLTNISRYDLPDPDVYRDFFRLNPLYEFKKLSETCTYFRGCPINKLDVAIAYDLPELVGKYKKMAEQALVSLEQTTADKNRNS